MCIYIYVHTYIFIYSFIDSFIYSIIYDIYIYREREREICKWGSVARDSVVCTTSYVNTMERWKNCANTMWILCENELSIKIDKNR